MIALPCLRFIRLNARLIALWKPAEEFKKQMAFVALHKAKCEGSRCFATISLLQGDLSESPRQVINCKDLALPFLERLHQSSEEARHLLSSLPLTV